MTATTTYGIVLNNALFSQREWLQRSKQQPPPLHWPLYYYVLTLEMRLGRECNCQRTNSLFSHLELSSIIILKYFIKRKKSKENLLAINWKVLPPFSTKQLRRYYLFVLVDFKIHKLLPVKCLSEGPLPNLSTVSCAECSVTIMMRPPVPSSSSVGGCPSTRFKLQ